MLENLALAFAAVCVVAGAALLYDAATAQDSNAPLRLLAGAAILAAGIITAVLASRSKLHWHRVQKQNRGQV